VRIVIVESDHDSFAPEQELARERGVELEIALSDDLDGLIENARGADGILMQYARLTPDALDRLAGVRAIGRYGVGVDTIDVAAATARGIAVCNVPDYGSEAVSDHAIALALSADAAALRRMRHGAILVNTSRGGTVDTAAVVDALRDGRLAGAALDVFETEPLAQDDPLLGLESVTLTPHAAWYTEESYRRLKRSTLENVIDVCSGVRPRVILNPEVLVP